MTRFVNPFEKPVYFEQALFLYVQFSKYLDDDFALGELSSLEYFSNLIKRTFPFFWVITEGDKVTGFVYLDNVVGNKNQFFSAELITCFDKKYWGIYTRICAYIFLKTIFQKYGFQKIKALIYPENSRVKTLLKMTGFKKEAFLKSETLRNGKMQDIEVYSVFRDKYINKKGLR